jgi:ketol-acid reductoisomerase
MEKKGFQSSVFPTEVIVLADTEEIVVSGGRDKFDLLSTAFQGIK